MSKNYLKTVEKLPERIQDNIEKLNFNENTEFEDLILAKLRQGGNLLAFPQSFDLKKVILLSSLYRSPESYEGCPRAIIITSDSTKALELKQFFDKAIFRTEISVELAHDRGKAIEQRNTLYDGADIIIGTPKRIFDLYIQNGINLSLLKLLILDDANQQQRYFPELIRICDSLPKCQRFVFAEKKNEKLEKLNEKLLVDFEEINSTI
jgi:ATP-dependent RNA helicase RhlE